MVRPIRGFGAVFSAALACALVAGVSASWAGSADGYGARHTEDEAYSSSYGYDLSRRHASAGGGHEHVVREESRRTYDAQPSYSREHAETRSVTRQQPEGYRRQASVGEAVSGDSYGAVQHGVRHEGSRRITSDGYIVEAYAPTTYDEEPVRENAAVREVVQGDDVGSGDARAYVAEGSYGRTYSESGESSGYAAGSDDGRTIESRYFNHRADLPDAVDLCQYCKDKAHGTDRVYEEQRSDREVVYSDERVVERREPESLHLSDGFFLGGGGVGPDVVDFGGGGGGGGFILAGASGSASASASASASVSARVGFAFAAHHQMMQHPMMKMKSGCGCGGKKY